MLYTDDFDIIKKTYITIYGYTKTCTTLKLTISLKKKPTTSSKHYHKPNKYIYGKNFTLNDKFVYLGSTINKFCTADYEITNRIKEVCDIFGKLE